MFRQLLLGVAGRPEVRDRLSRVPAARRLAERFVAGETLDDGMRVVRALNAQGLSATLDCLGEHTTHRAAAAAATQDYLALLERLHAERLDANVSLKLTQLGLDLDLDLCRAKLTDIVRRAHDRRNFVRIDMEESRHTQRTLDVFRQVYQLYPDAVGPVIQAYLYRSERDVRWLIRAGARVRLCKGAYAESPAVAFARKRDVDANYVRLMELLLLLGNYPAIATHDERIIRLAKRFASTWGLGRERFEFQMLYGIRRDLQEGLVREGCRVRIYVPYGTAWYPYLTRRLAERPANALFVAGSIAREALAGGR